MVVVENSVGVDGVDVDAVLCHTRWAVSSSVPMQMQVVAVASPLLVTMLVVVDVVVLRTPVVVDDHPAHDVEADVVAAAVGMVVAVVAAGTASASSRPIQPVDQPAAVKVGDGVDAGIDRDENHDHVVAMREVMVDVIDSRNRLGVV